MSASSCWRSTQAIAGGDVATAVAGLAAGFEPACARLPGRNRKDPGPVEVDADLWARVLSLAKG
jgi:hypothetical protein